MGGAWAGLVGLRASAEGSPGSAPSPSWASRPGSTLLGGQVWGNVCWVQVGLGSNVVGLLHLWWWVAASSAWTPAPEKDLRRTGGPCRRPQST